MARLGTVVLSVRAAASPCAEERKRGTHPSVPAASIRCLEGAELAVMQVNSNQQICAQFDFQNNLPLQVRPDGGRVSAKGSKLHFLIHAIVSAFTVLWQGY